MVTFEVSNAGSIPHGFEVEGRGLEQRTPQIQPGSSATLKLDLRVGSYETYCPIGKGSHKMLGMMNHLIVGNVKRAAATDSKEETEEKGKNYAACHGSAIEHGEHGHAMDRGAGAVMMKVAGGGPVIQIL